MIFPKPLDRLAREGRKTEARLRVSARRDGAVRPCRYRPGRSYAIQRELGGAEIGRVEILAVRRALLADATFQDARAEGWRTLVEFQDHWMCQHDRSWPPVEDCATCDGGGLIATGGCPDCGRSGVIPADITEDDIREWFDRKHADTLVWVITFQLDDAARLLAARPSSVRDRGVDQDADHGYTTNPALAMPDEPEAIDAALLAVYSEDARQRYSGQPGRREEQLRRRAKSLATRLRQAGHVNDEAAAQLEQVEAAIRSVEGQRRGAA